MTRSDILSFARRQDPSLGDDCMIVEMEWGYWVGSEYVSKVDIQNHAKVKA